MLQEPITGLFGTMPCIGTIPRTVADAVPNSALAALPGDERMRTCQVGATVAADCAHAGCSAKKLTVRAPETVRRVRVT